LYKGGAVMSEQMTPRQIVHELDRFIIGQEEAKKAVAIALRNRYRRSRVEEKLRDEIIPKNILMIGPTGVGKTEIARRLAKLANAPFLNFKRCLPEVVVPSGYIIKGITGFPSIKSLCLWIISDKISFFELVLFLSTNIVSKAAASFPKIK